MTDPMIRYVGLDVHKRVVEACLVDQAGNIVHRERFALNHRTLELFATQVLRPTDHVALEATTNCWAVADVLRPHVAKVLVSNPMATKAIAQAKVKTDKVDAHVLAQLLRCDFLPEVWPPDQATRRLRELTGRRSALIGQRTAMRNRIHSVLPPPGQEEEPQRGRGRRSPQARGHRLADARHRRALPLCDPAFDGGKALAVAGQRHGPAPQEWFAERHEVRGPTSRREPRDPLALGRVPVRGAARAEAAFVR